MAALDLDKLLYWTGVPAPHFVGGNRVRLLQGGDALFPSMLAAIEGAAREVWLATYIFHDDPGAVAIMRALAAAARRGVAVHVVVDGFGSKATLSRLRAELLPAGVRLEVFRPIERWYAVLQPGQMRRLHQKLCVCDAGSGGSTQDGPDFVAFVGGINVIDDRLDLRHGWGEEPRLDFAVELRGPLAGSVHAATRAMWVRSHLWQGWRDEVRQVVGSAAPLAQTRSFIRRLRGVSEGVTAGEAAPVRAALVVRDNLRQRRSIERSYVEAIKAAHSTVDIAVPYFYPGQRFRRALRRAARRGVRVRLLLQGKVDYRIAALAARALYDELRANGVRIYEYTPAYLHAKVAVVDGRWSTVGSSTIDPMSLLLNLEANVVVDDEGFAGDLLAAFEAAFAASAEVAGAPTRAGWRGWLRRTAVAWMANAYLRVAGITGRY
ncbi:MAG: cardiolipin synthase ClsB [Pseudomonadota bacterium]